MSAKSSFLHSISPCSVWVHQSTSLLHPLDGFPLQFFDTCFISQAREAPVTWQALSSFSKNSTFWRSLSRHHRQISVHSAIMLSSFAAMPNDSIVSLYLSLDRFPGEQRPYFFIFTFPNIRCNTWLPAGSQTLTGWMNKQSHADKSPDLALILSHFFFLIPKKCLQYTGPVFKTSPGAFRYVYSD